jgi:hypothetical protein
MTREMLSRSALEVLKDEEGSVALGWVASGVLYSRFSGGLSLDVGTLHHARLEDTLRQVESVRYYVDSSALEYYDLLARRAFTRIVLTHRHRFSELVLLTWAGGISKTAEKFAAALGEPVTIVTEPRVFERLLSRVAPFARQRLEPRTGWSSAPRENYKPS